jgi:16S rRNA (guanine527-N7)-methyltransferase
MKGKKPEEEVARLPEDVEVMGIIPLNVPGLSAERCVVLMEKTEN